MVVLQLGALASICETTEGVSSYSGYIDLDEHSHMFFWFFEARRDAETAPITPWLNGGPGSDSLIGLFTEIGPCTVNPDLRTTPNPFSWSEYSNLLFLSQPLGVGLSYGTEVSVINITAIDTTRLAAMAAWKAVQAFVVELPRMSPRVASRDFNLWTALPIRIPSSQREGALLNLRTLGIGNGIIDAALQFPMYSNFTVNNTYGIQPLDDQIVSYTKFALTMYNGCLDQIYRCRQAYSSDVDSRASDMCRDNVEGPYYEYGGHSMYDIRKSSQDPPYPDFFVKYLNLPSTQEALGVDLLFEYEPSSNEVYSAFELNGGYVYPGFLEDLGFLLDKGIRGVLTYGDADYIGNWFGGSAVSLAVNYSQAPLFRSSSYVRLNVDGADHGIVREYGNFNFVIVYDAGHTVSIDKPDVALGIFRRSVLGLDIATGLEPVSNQTAVPLVT
ncbi:Alpha/Beta hydrolase protein [Coniochaeta sp. 2T2.1]|nr:Alpha/Beta hydrolase protein [Coniochaeta sp. 2T2.1]